MGCRHYYDCLLLGFLLSFLCSSRLAAQSIPIEVGIQLTGTHLHKLDQTPLGIGGRALFQFAPGTSLDIACDFRPCHLLPRVHSSVLSATWRRPSRFSLGPRLFLRALLSTRSWRLR